MSKIVNYFSGVKKEMSRVRWTNKKDLLKYSVAAVGFVLFFALFFYAVDYGVTLIRTIK